MAEQVGYLILVSFEELTCTWARLRSRSRTKNNTCSKMRKLAVCSAVLSLSFLLIYLWLSGGRKVATKEKRWYKDVGLGFKTPAEAINGQYIGAPRWCFMRQEE